MDQRMLAALCRTIVGPTGRRLPAYPDIQAAYTKGLFADYYFYNPQVGIKTFYKYANSSTPFPHFLIRHYGGANDYRRTLSDMIELVDSCPSLTLLKQIQNEVFQWATAYLPKNEAAEVCKNYVGQNATRREIAIFLADVMHYAITRTENIEHRPSDSGSPDVLD